MYAYLEADLGRAPHAMVRLLERVRSSNTDPDLFAALTQICRYCGLLEASLAAHDRAYRLDPNIRTSVAHTQFVLGNYERVLDYSFGDFGYIDALALTQLGREQPALELLRERTELKAPLPRLKGQGVQAELGRLRAALGEEAFAAAWAAGRADEFV